MAESLQFQEIGTPGLESWSGYIQEAYNAKLYWPECYPDLNRIRRSDPEISMVRTAFTALVRGANLDWETGDDPTPDEEAFQEFGREVFEDMEGGIGGFLETMVSYVPFLGWGWWVPVPGKRVKNWRPPDQDPWRSQFDDGLIGLRRIAWRDHSSFHRWDLQERTKRLLGLVQLDPPNSLIALPLDQSLHLTFGDPNNPEGLSPLEAVWRMERIKYGLEIVQGIGYEHAAGYLSVSSSKELTTEDKAMIRKVARAVLTAQEGNYLALPDYLKAEIIDVPFAAAANILAAIRYYGLLKLQVYMMQWMAISTTADTGSYSSHESGADMGMLYFNGMMEGFAKQIDEQLGKRLYEWNKDKFPGIERRPRIVAIPVEKNIPLDQLGAFISIMNTISPLDDDDIVAIRRKSGFLPESIPENKGPAEPEQEEEEIEKEEIVPEEEAEETETGEMSRRPFMIGADEKPIDVIATDGEITKQDIEGAFRRFLKYADEHEPLLAGLMRAKVKEIEE